MLSLTCVLGPNGLAVGTGGCATVLQVGLWGQNVVLLACVLTPEGDSFPPLRAAQWSRPPLGSLGMLLKCSALLR